MLNKIFGNKIFSQGRHVATAPPGPAGLGPRQSRAVKIIHAGGHVEHYYMATPAAMIIQKHPSFILARPEIFKRPWDSVVRFDEILVPGQKYYIVPRKTVKKLRRRIRKPSATGPGPGPDLSLTENDSEISKSSFSGILVKPGIKAKARNLHVRFFGIDSTNQQDGSDAVSNPSSKKSGKKTVNGSKMNEKKERARIEFAWEPALQSITE